MGKAKRRRGADAHKRTGLVRKKSTRKGAKAAASPPCKPVSAQAAALQAWVGLAPTVRYLATHSVPSPALPPRLAEIFCVSPVETSRFHTYRAPLLSWATVRRIPPGTRCSDPGLMAKERSKRLALAAQLPYSSTYVPEGVPLHPACGQHGMFATCDIPPRTFLFPYLGVVHTEHESDAASEYDLRLWAPIEHDLDEPKLALGVDATHAGSYARFVNDFRGILARPNLTFDDWSDLAPDGKRAHGIGLFSGSRPITAGTELCVSYGKGFWKARAGG